MSQSFPVNGLPPSTGVSLHTYFFIASWCPEPTGRRFAPTGRAGDRFFHPNWSAKRGRVLEGVFPLGRHVSEALVDDLRRGRLAASKFWNPPEADAVHPLEVEFDAFFRDVPIHPMPPNAGLGGLRRIFKAAA